MQHACSHFAGLREYQLREYRGVSNSRHGNGHDLNVAIQSQPSERRADTGEGAVDQAARRQLTGRCLSP